MPLRRVQRLGVRLRTGSQVRKCAPWAGSRTARRSLPADGDPRARESRHTIRGGRGRGVRRRACGRGVVAGVGSASAACGGRAAGGPGLTRTIATSAPSSLSSAASASSLVPSLSSLGRGCDELRNARRRRVPHLGRPLEDLGAPESQDGPPRRPQQRVAMRVVEPRRDRAHGRRRRSRPRGGAGASGSRPADARHAGSRAARRRRRARGTRPRRRSWSPGSRCGAARSRVRERRACVVRWLAPSRRGRPPRRTSRGTPPRA